MAAPPSVARSRKPGTMHNNTNRGADNHEARKKERKDTPHRLNKKPAKK